MKTIKNKKSQSIKGNKDTNRHLFVEKPTANKLLSTSISVLSAGVAANLISSKADKTKRRQQQSSLIMSISLCLSFLMVIGLFEWKIEEKDLKIDFTEQANTFDELIDVPPTKQIQAPPVQSVAPVFIEVSDDEEIMEDIKVDLDIEMTEDTRIENVTYEPTTTVLPEEKTDEIFTIVEEQPSPVGGMKAFYEYVGSHLRFPPKAARMGIEGRVFVEFVVEKDGTLTDIRVAKGIGGGCDEEAIRVISNASKWNPGKQRGRPVRVRMIMPIMFKLMT